MRMMLIKENMLQDTRDGKLGCFVFVLPIFISTGRAVVKIGKTANRMKKADNCTNPQENSYSYF